MARQSQDIPIVGTIDGINFYKMGGNYYARMAADKPKRGTKAYAGYQRFLETATELGKVSPISRILRLAFGEIIPRPYTNERGSLHNRIIQVIMAGNRNPQNRNKLTGGNVGLLEGFDFNFYARMVNTFRAPYNGRIDRVNGRLFINLPSFVPEESISAPDWTTHFKIVSGGVAIDFENGLFETDIKESDLFSWGRRPTKDIEMEHTVAGNSDRHLFLALGINFYQRWPGEIYQIESGCFDVLTIIKINVES